MKKQEFIKAVAQHLDTTQVESRTTLEGVFAVIEEALVEGKKVPLGDLGRLSTVERAARKGRNPQTGEEIEIPARKAVKYTASKHAKEVVQ